MTANDPMPRSGSTRRAWQRMLSGRRLDLLNPSPLDIEIEDIAHGLARVARWNGQTTGQHAYSVAQHSLLVEDIATRIDPNLSAAARLIVLLHDAPEYVIGDLITPFKTVIGDRYKEIETGLQAAVLIRFGLPKPNAQLGPLIKRADKAAAFLEATQLAGFAFDEAIQTFGRPEAIGGSDWESLFSLQPLPASKACETFLECFEMLMKEREKSDERN